MLDQLVIHSDFDLLKHDRLFDDLRALRQTLKAKLALQLSSEPIHVYLFENEKRFKSFLNKFNPYFPPAGRSSCKVSTPWPVCALGGSCSGGSAA